MAERFADAALRHLGTAEVLEEESRIDDAAYHYGLVGEMALKVVVLSILGSLPKELYVHINQKNKSLQSEIAKHTDIVNVMRAGRLGGALGLELSQGSLTNRFAGWSINIRYADNNHCPVDPTNLSRWKADALSLYNDGVF